MKKRNDASIIGSFILIAMLAGIIEVDLLGVFDYSDIPFLLVIVLYVGILYIQRASSKLSFILSLSCLVFMELSYIPTGASRVTERFGEWFYLFFVFGLIHYMKEVFSTIRRAT